MRIAKEEVQKARQQLRHRVLSRKYGKQEADLIEAVFTKHDEMSAKEILNLNNQLDMFDKEE